MPIRFKGSAPDSDTQGYLDKFLHFADEAARRKFFPTCFVMFSLRPAKDARNRPNPISRPTGLVSSALRTLALALKSNHTRRAGAIFVTSRDEPPIRTHFRRLQKQTEGLLDLSYIVNPSDFPEPERSLSYVSPRKMMPRRMQRMVENVGM